jgi:hypothetical protein
VWSPEFKASVPLKAKIQDGVTDNEPRSAPWGKAQMGGPVGIPAQPIPVPSQPSMNGPENIPYPLLSGLSLNLLVHGSCLNGYQLFKALPSSPGSSFHHALGCGTKLHMSWAPLGRSMFSHHSSRTCASWLRDVSFRRQEPTDPGHHTPAPGTRWHSQPHTGSVFIPSSLRFLRVHHGHLCSHVHTELGLPGILPV